jgi:hypothetical protein
MTNKLKYQMAIQWSEEENCFWSVFLIFQDNSGVLTAKPMR